MKKQKLPEEPNDVSEGELFQSPDGDRIILYQTEETLVSWTEFVDDEVIMGDGDFDFLFYNWIKVGDL